MHTCFANYLSLSQNLCFLSLNERSIPALTVMANTQAHVLLDATRMRRDAVAVNLMKMKLRQSRPSFVLAKILELE